MKATSYKKLSDIDHILVNPQRHIGNHKKDSRTEYIHSKTGIHPTEFETPEAVCQCFKEAFTNASDHLERSKALGYESPPIRVWVTDTIVRIRNGGAPIPVEIHPVEKIYVPELIFGVLKTGSNFKKDKDEKKGNKGAGKHGEGVKLANVFSKRFEIKVGDSVNKKFYTQKWEDNMKTRYEPEIEKYKGEPFVEVEYELDFKYFKMDSYDKRTKYFFKTFCSWLTYCLNVEVYFNDKLLKVPSDLEFGLTHFAVEEDDIAVFKSGSLRVILANTPNEGRTLAFCNGLYLQEGGKHLEKVVEIIGREFIKKAKEDYVKKFKSKDETDEQLMAKAGHMMKITKVKDNLSFIVVANMEDPDFKGGQIKVALQTFDEEIKVPKKIYDKLSTWDFNKSLLEVIDKKIAEAMKATDGKGEKRSKLKRGEIECDFAKSKKTWPKAICVFCEGLSAMAYPTKMREHVPDGIKSISIFPLRGKILNSRTATANQLLTNKEINGIKKFINLKDGKVYNDLSDLRHQEIWIMTDADNDGQHIIGLFLDIFEFRWPSLLKIKGFIKIRETPFKTLTRGKKMVLVYSEKEATEYKSQGKWVDHYKKGLGSCKDAEIILDCQNPRFTELIYDKKASKIMTLAFARGQEDNRKEWIAAYRPPEKPHEPGHKMKITTFFSERFIVYSIVDLQRCTPWDDGLKPSQRQAVYGAILKWGYKPKSPQSIKLGNFSAFTQEQTQYHYGPNGITDAIVKMCWNFVGSNNLSYFEPDGQFGTRMQGGKDAASPRYVETRPMPYFHLLFRSDDDPLLERIDVDGKKGEPRVMFPVVPLHLVNGARGIGVGWASVVIPVHPVTLCEWYLARNEGKDLPKLKPFYRGFRGKVKIGKMGKDGKRASKKTKGEVDEDQLEEVDEIKKENDEEDEEQVQYDEYGRPELKDDLPDKDEVLIDKNTKYRVVTKGIFEIDSGKINITELPIGRWTLPYRDFLLDEEEAGDIKDFDNNCKNNSVDFTIYGMKKEANIKNLRLQKSFGMNNMVVIKEDGSVARYETLEDVAEAFYQFRLPIYQKRKDMILAALREKRTLLKKRMRIIELIAIEKKVEVRQKRKVWVKEQLAEFGADPEPYDGMKIEDLNEEKIEEYQRELEEIQDKINTLKATTPNQLWNSDLKELRKGISKYFE